MAIVLWAVLLLFFLPPLFVVLFVWLHRRTYRHQAIIIREIGGETKVMIDRFRSRPKKDQVEEVHGLEFLKHVKVKAPAPSYKHWLKFWTNKKYSPDEAVSMNYKTLQRSLREGAIFYQPTEHELKPCVVEKGNIRVLDNDNRQWIVSELASVDRFVKQSEGKWKQIVMVVGPIFFSILGAVIMWIIFQTQMSENISLMCNQAAAAATKANVLDVVRSVGA